MTCVYLAGPMTGVADYNRPAFHAAERALRSAGLDVVNPARVSPGFVWSDYMRQACRVLPDCDGLALLADADASAGARLETLIAVACGLRIGTVAEWIAGRLPLLTHDRKSLIDLATHDSALLCLQFLRLEH